MYCYLKGEGAGGACVIDTTAPGFAYRVDGRRVNPVTSPTTEEHAAARLLLQGNNGIGRTAPSLPPPLHAADGTWPHCYERAETA